VSLKGSRCRDVLAQPESTASRGRELESIHVDGNSLLLNHMSGRSGRVWRVDAMAIILLVLVHRLICPWRWCHTDLGGQGIKPSFPQLKKNAPDSTVKTTYPCKSLSEAIRACTSSIQSLASSIRSTRSLMRWCKPLDGHWLETIRSVGSVEERSVWIKKTEIAACAVNKSRRGRRCAGLGPLALNAAVTRKSNAVPTRPNKPEQKHILPIVLDPMHVL